MDINLNVNVNLGERSIEALLSVASAFSGLKTEVHVAPPVKKKPAKEVAAPVVEEQVEPVVEAEAPVVEPKVEEPAAVVEEPKEVKLTLEDLRKEAAWFNEADDRKAKIKPLLAAIGVETIAKTPKEKYKEVLDLLINTKKEMQNG